MSEVEREPSPEEQERDRLIRIIRKYFPEDEVYLLETFPDSEDTEDLRMAIDTMLTLEGFDPDPILMEEGEYVEVRYDQDNKTGRQDYTNHIGPSHADSEEREG